MYFLCTHGSNSWTLELQCATVKTSFNTDITNIQFEMEKDSLCSLCSLISNFSSIQIFENCWEEWLSLVELVHHQGKTVAGGGMRLMNRCGKEKVTKKKIPNRMMMDHEDILIFCYLSPFNKQSSMSKGENRKHTVWTQGLTTRFGGISFLH